VASASQAVSASVAAAQHDQPARWEAALAGEVVFAAAAAFGGLRPTAYDNYVYLAQAWLHGRLWIHWPGDWIDAIPYHGRAYVIEAPTPGVLMLPLVAVWGEAANQTLVSALLLGLGAAAGWTLCRRIGLRPALCALTVGMLVFASTYFYAGAVGDVWFIAHASAVTFSMLALAELHGRRRGWLVALWAIAAAFSRYPLLPAVAVYAWLVYQAGGRRGLRDFALVALPLAGLWVAYNLARWGTVFDIGFTLFWKIMDVRSKSGEPAFGLLHVPMQLRALFGLSGPAFTTAFPWIVPPKFGLSLTWTSLGFSGAFWAPLRERYVPYLWLLAILTLVPTLLYYGTGDYQFGARHALDFLPFVTALLAYGLRRGVPRPILAVCVLNVAFGLYEVIAFKYFS
jgi:hypothetical protein